MKKDSIQKLFIVGGSHVKFIFFKLEITRFRILIGIDLILGIRFYYEGSSLVLNQVAFKLREEQSTRDHVDELMLQKIDYIKFLLYSFLSLFMMLPISPVTKPVEPFYFQSSSTLNMRKNGLIKSAPFFFFKQSLDEVTLKATAKNSCC